MIFATPPAPVTPERAAIDAAYLQDEATCLTALMDAARSDAPTRARIAQQARRLVDAVRGASRESQGLDAFLAEYDLSSQEGVVLMCLAEALLRVPDAETADRLIRDKLAEADWERHLGHSHSLFVNAGTWGLMLTGRIVKLDRATVADIGGFVQRLVARSGEPVIRLALREGMAIMAHQFVMGRTIEEALARSLDDEWIYSFDMLGEAALARADAERYLEAYSTAIAAVASSSGAAADVFRAPGISVKLSALHPRFEFAQRDRVLSELPPHLLRLAREARAADVGLTVDAEEADRLGITLDVFAAVYTDSALRGWEGFGLALQAYQKRALPALEWLIGLARRHGRRIPVRLVKGAYWDTEVKRAQERSLDGYPVFTRKASTDVAYLACARRMLAATDALYAQFASHNAYTVAAVLTVAGDGPFEFQRLHGMGEDLYREVQAMTDGRVRCRVYAPVGSHEDLLPYLVRRLLENGANTSFVNRIADEQAPIDSLIADPVEIVAAHAHKPHPRIPLPRDLYGAERSNSRGLNLTDPNTLNGLAQAMANASRDPWRAVPIVDGTRLEGPTAAIHSPADHARLVGEVVEADGAATARAIASAAAAQPEWDRTPAAQRAHMLRAAADLLEAHHPELMARVVLEGGRTIADAASEVREAVDYCRYYAALAAADFGTPAVLPGPTGESNELTLHGRGVFACISPWNFPLAIFTGQVVGALAAGNAVVAKPASQTPLTAARVITLLHEAGVPPQVLQFTPGGGSRVGRALVEDARVAGVVFTGSTETAQAINQALAARSGPIARFIAETGGQNVMIADSSALPEQVVQDVLASAFNSAGQRCSALRVLFVQEDIAPRLVELLAGAIAELRIGDPALLATDIGPVIDDHARQTLNAHIEWLRHQGRLIGRTPLPNAAAQGCFVAPCAFEIDALSLLQREVFGPVLHVIRYRANALDEVIAAMNATGYGLTLGIHSRIAATARYIRQRVRVGNVYVNRNMIGAVVGVQPFGGEGLSGTGPKAGGPHYLNHLALERCYTVNTAAVGGNATLLSLAGDVPLAGD